jgi:UDP-GlcNAc:undecaprenyl-phosphate GlcNAc-1-phosphate transferase
MGVQLLYFWFPGQGILSLSADLAVPLTVLWILAMINGINFIDGLDGLAAGMVAIAAIAFFLYVYRGPGLFEGASTAALLCAVTAGACVGFLPWNFNPAKIFMGDSGSGLLGLLLAVATISGVGRNPYPPSGGDVAVYAIPILLPLLVLAIPFLDVVLAVIRRFRQNKPLSHADKEHIHHQLLDLGHSHREAVLMMYLWSGLISFSALAVAFINGREKVAMVLLVVLVIFGLTVIPRLMQYWRMVKEDRASNGNGRSKGGAHRKGGNGAAATAKSNGGSNDDEDTNAHQPA